MTNNVNVISISYDIQYLLIWCYNRYEFNLFNETSYIGKTNDLIGGLYGKSI